MTLPYEIPYNPTPRAIVFFSGAAIITFALGAVPLFHLFPTNLFSLFFLSFTCLMLLRRFVWPRQLTLADDSMVVPSGFLRLQPVAVPYGHIVRVWVHRVAATSVLCVKTIDRQVEIQDIYLPDSATFQRLKHFLESAAESAKKAG